MPIRITHPDPGLAPVMAFFAFAADFDFPEVMDTIVSGIGSCINDACCSFPTGDDQFEGVHFSVLSDEVVISVEELHHFVREACEAQARRLPQQAPALKVVLAKIPQA